MNFIDKHIADTDPELWQEMLAARKEFDAQTEAMIAGIDSNTTYEEALDVVTRKQRHERLNTFKGIMSKLDTPPLWAGELLVYIWTDAEPYDLLSCDGLTTPEERIYTYAQQLSKYRKQLAPTLDRFKGQGEIVLYSGSTLGRPSHSWTLDINTARKFVGRVSRHRRGEGQLLTMTIDGDELAKTACFYTDDRSEQEVYFLQDMQPQSDRT